MSKPFIGSFPNSERLAAKIVGLKYDGYKPIPPDEMKVSPEK